MNADTMNEAREVGDRQTDALIQHDLEAVLDTYSDDAVVMAPEGRFEGKKQIREYLRQTLEPFANMKVKILSKFESGDKAMDEWEFKVKHEAELMLPDGSRVSPTGKELTFHGSDVYEVHDGHITEHHLYYDPEELQKQLGQSGQLGAVPA